MKKTVTFFTFIFCTAIAQAQSWSELGGTNGAWGNGNINTMFVDAQGALNIAGDFNASGARYVGIFNDTVFTALGHTNLLSVGNTINSICADKYGNVYAAGFFVNSNTNGYVAKWDKAKDSLSELGGINSLAANGRITSICSDTAGNIYAAGYFTNASGKFYVAKWDGINWSEVGGLNALSANNYISSITFDKGGNLYAAGSFTNSSGKKYVAKWNGTAWSEVTGLNANSVINCIFCDKTNAIYAAGYFTNSSGSQYVAKWNGSNWSEVGGANSLAANFVISAICSDTAGNVYAAGQFTNAGGQFYVAKWNKQANVWSELGGGNSLGASSFINTICNDEEGNIYAAGQFTNGIGQRYVAKYTLHNCLVKPIAMFTISPDTLQPHHWFALNQCSGAGQLQYAWSWGDHSTNDTGATPTHTYASPGYYNVCVTVMDSAKCKSHYCDSSTYINRNSAANSMAYINVVKSLPVKSGLQEVNSISIHICPNPTNKSLVISMQSFVNVATIKLINLAGQTVIEKQNESGNQFTLDLTNQTAGIYFVEVQQGGNVWRGKVVKE